MINLPPNFMAKVLEMYGRRNVPIPTRGTLPQRYAPGYQRTREARVQANRPPRNIKPVRQENANRASPNPTPPPGAKPAGPGPNGVFLGGSRTRPTQGNYLKNFARQSFY